MAPKNKFSEGLMYVFCRPTCNNSYSHSVSETRTRNRTENRTVSRMVLRVYSGCGFTVSLWCYVFLLSLFLRADCTSAETTVSPSQPAVRYDELTADQVTTVEKGMRPFYDMVKSFLDVVQPHRISEQSWLNISLLYTDNHFNGEQLKEWKNWVTYLIGFTICAAVGVLFFVVMPITGLIFCCCRCCGKCGGRHKPHDPKRAGCKRRSYCSVLLLLNTVALAGVVCAFLSNEVVYTKLRNDNNLGPIGKINFALDKLKKYTNDTLLEVETATLDRFDAVKGEIIDDIKNSAKQAIDDVLRSLNATALLSQTKDLSRVVNTTRDELNNVAAQLKILQTGANSLMANLTDIADNVKKECQRLPQVSCNNFNKADYTTSANFSHLGDLSNEAANVAKSLDLGKYITDAENNIEQTKNTTSSSVDDGINQASQSVGNVRAQISDGNRQLQSEASNNFLVTIARLQSDLGKAENTIKDYSKYWWYGGLAVSCALLLIVVLYYIGVLFGLCGERPGLGAQCCNTGTGANFLMAGVGFTFLLAWLIMAVVVVLFVTGGPLHTELCRYFSDHQPRELKPFSDLVMRVSQLRETLYKDKKVDLDIVTVLEECQSNQPIYQVMRLDYLVNISQYTDLSPLKTQLDQLGQKSFQIPDIEIMTKELNDTIREFAASGIDNIPFDQYYREVNKNLTTADLQVLAEKLRNLGNMPYGDPLFKGTMYSLAKRLDDLYLGVIQDMKRAVASLNGSLTFLDVDVRQAIKVKTDALLIGLQTSENQFNVEKQHLVKTQLSTVTKNVLEKAQDSINDMLDDVHNNIGRCKPIFDGFYSASDSVCVVFLEPVNGFWFSVGWCLFFFIPILIFAVKLAGLYRREHDEKEFDDPNYIMYAGNQDTIPLTSVDRVNRPYHPSQAYPRPSGGASNVAYTRDSYAAPTDKYAPPPYSTLQNGSAGMSGSRLPGEYRPGYSAYDDHYRGNQKGSHVY